MAKHPGNEVEYKKYKAVLKKSKDDVSRILLTHLYMERLLERYINSKVSKSKRLFGKNGLSFIQKLNLAYAFNEFDDQLYESLNKVNKLRNDIAHQVGFDIDQEQVENLGRTLGKRYAEIKKNVSSEDKILQSVLSRLTGMLARRAYDSEAIKD